MFRLLKIVLNVCFKIQEINSQQYIMPLRKHAYSNILKILRPKKENFQIKNSDIFHISAQNNDCGFSLEPPRRGSSNEYPHSMLLCRNKKNNVYPCKPQFYYIKVGFMWGQNYVSMFSSCYSLPMMDLLIYYITKTQECRVI